MHMDMYTSGREVVVAELAHLLSRVQGRRNLSIFLPAKPSQATGPLDKAAFHDTGWNETF